MLILHDEWLFAKWHNQTLLPIEVAHKGVFWNIGVKIFINLS